MIWPRALGGGDETQNAADASHRGLSHGHRIDVLAERIALHIESLVRQGRVRCLDVGCGDMTLADAVHERTSRTDWSCIDTYGRPADVSEDERWSKYRQFDGRTIPYADGEFDVALLCDVLHHAPEDAAKLLAEAGRVATHVLVKDHFEYGPYSRKMLQLADFVGTCMGEGGSVPERYFTREGFVRLAAQQHLVITALDSELDLYEHLPGMNTLLRRDWQFIAVLRCH